MTPIANYRVLQYNVLHQKKGWTTLTHLFEIPFSARATNVAKAITDCTPDIVLLAERHDEWAGVETDAMDGAVVLVDLLGNHYAMIQDTIAYEGCTAVNRVPIVYNTQKLKCVDSGFLRLTEECAFHVSQNKRIVTWAILEDISDSNACGTKLAVFNTHWSILEYKGVSYTEIRQAQSKEMQELINSPRFQGIAHIAGGDYNAVYADKLYDELLQGSGLADADMTVNGKITYNNVDHIAVSGADFISYAVHKVNDASDHYPIYCDIKI
jgi:endonuclease/exonuclease/phosphatase family metal-dependent hydrolase